MKPTLVKPPPKRKTWWQRARSAITGMFVSLKWAKANPKSTVVEKVEKKT